MRTMTVLALTLTLLGCSAPKPVNVIAGEACWRCRQPINDKRIAAELVAPNGLASKFRTIHCMSTWIGQQKGSPEGVYYVTDYGTGKWIRADRANYVRTIVNTNTMAHDFIAFSDRSAAEVAAKKDNVEVASWDSVLAFGKASPLGGN